MKPWKTFAESKRPGSRCLLQWGHGDEAVEDSDVPIVTTGKERFNGATAMKPWKTVVPSIARSL